MIRPNVKPVHIAGWLVLRMIVLGMGGVLEGSTSPVCVRRGCVGVVSPLSCFACDGDACVCYQLSHYYLAVDCVPPLPLVRCQDSEMFGVKPSNNCSSYFAEY